jgi:hypothetical protein
VSRTDNLGIFIATTKGSVGIQRITEEDSDIDSVVCLAGKAMPLPISNSYQDFVRQPTGVVQRDFGHGSFRVDLSATIEDGYSWQLGLYLGHAAASSGRLTGDVPAGAIHIFVTGEVNVDLKVLAVDHVAVKLDQLKNHVTNLSAAGERIIIIVPSDNLSEVPDEWVHGSIELHGVTTVSEALDAVGLTAKPRTGKTPPVIIAPETIPEKPVNTTRRLVLLLTGLITIGAAAAYTAYFSGFEDWKSLKHAGKYRALDTALNKAAEGDALDRLRAIIYRNYLIRTRPDKDQLRIRLIEHRAPEGKTCAAVRFGVAKIVLKEAQRRSDRVFEAAQFDGLCQLEFIAEADKNTTYLWGRYVRWPSGQNYISQIITNGPSRQKLRWKIDLPRRLPLNFKMHIVVAAGYQPVDGASGWVAEQIPPGHPDKIIAGWEERLRALNARGIELIDATFILKR